MKAPVSMSRRSSGRRRDRATNVCVFGPFPQVSRSGACLAGSFYAPRAPAEVPSCKERTCLRTCRFWLVQPGLLVLEKRAKMFCIVVLRLVSRCEVISNLRTRNRGCPIGPTHTRVSGSQVRNDLTPRNRHFQHIFESVCFWPFSSSL